MKFKAAVLISITETSSSSLFWFQAPNSIDLCSEWVNREIIIPYDNNMLDDVFLSALRLNTLKYWSAALKHGEILVTKAHSVITF